MALITNAIKGTLDTLPAESYKVQYVEAAMREIAENYGFYEMRTPVFEHTELFQRSVGETTDVVQKECTPLRTRAAVRLPFVPRALPVRREPSSKTVCSTRLCLRKYTI